MWLTFIAIRNAIGILMAALAIVVLGATSLHRMPIDLFPNINLPVLTIGTIYTGANVQDIEKTVTYPIEKAVSAVANVEHVESKSRQGVSAVQVWFNFDADINADSNSNSDANANADCKDDSVQCCKLCDRRSRSKFNPFRHPLRRHQWHSDCRLRHQRQRRLAEL